MSMATARASTASRLSTLQAALALAALTSIPLVDLGLDRLRFGFLPKRGLNLTLFDLLIWIAAAGMVLDAILRRRTG